jgi:hypothetical protein
MVAHEAAAPIEAITARAGCTMFSGPPAPPLFRSFSAVVVADVVVVVAAATFQWCCLPA